MPNRKQHQAACGATVPAATCLIGILIGTCLCFGTSYGKIPPTLPVCPEAEEQKVAECQNRLNASLVSQLPADRMFFTGQMQPTVFSRVCKLVTQHSACETAALGFCRRVRPTPPPTDYFFMSLGNFCYNGAFNDYPTLFLCYQYASRQTSECYADFKSVHQQPGLLKDANCRLYKTLVDCVSTAIGNFCGKEAVRLAEPLLELSLPDLAYCASNTFMEDSGSQKNHTSASQALDRSHFQKYILSMQADPLVAEAADREGAGGYGKQSSANAGARSSGTEALRLHLTLIGLAACFVLYPPLTL